jgi:REP element-mobilizing transposase RayT
MKLEQGLPDLRQAKEYQVVWGALAAARERAGTSENGWFGLVHYSIQGDHMHLVVEANDNDSMSRALNGLAVRIARGLNKLWERTGSVFADRYHCKVLRTPRQVYNTLRYIFENARRHGLPRMRGRPDVFSSGLWFTGWKDYVHDGFLSWEGPVTQARSWLLREGWKRYGLLEVRPTWDIYAA